MRRCLVNQRTDIKNHVRGILKTYGIRLGAVGPTKFNEAVSHRIQELNHLVQHTMKDTLEVFDMLTQKITRLDQELLKIAHQDKDARLLMTAQGIGPITALTYKAEIFDPSRFPNTFSGLKARVHCSLTLHIKYQNP